MKILTAGTRPPYMIQVRRTVLQYEVASKQLATHRMKSFTGLIIEPSTPPAALSFGKAVTVSGSSAIKTEGKVLDAVTWPISGVSRQREPTQVEE